MIQLCPFSRDRKLSISCRLSKCVISMAMSIGSMWFANLYGGGLYLRESVMGGSTIQSYSYINLKIHNYYAIHV